MAIFLLFFLLHMPATFCMQSNEQQIEIVVDYATIVDEVTAEEAAQVFLTEEDKEYMQKEKFLKPIDKTLDVFMRLGNHTYTLLKKNNLQGEISRHDYVIKFTGDKSIKLYRLYYPQ